MPNERRQKVPELVRCNSYLMMLRAKTISGESGVGALILEAAVVETNRELYLFACWFPLRHNSEL